MADQIVTPEQAQQSAQDYEFQQRLAKKRKEFRQILGIAGHNRATVPGLEIQPDGAGGFSVKDTAIDFGKGILDLVQRGNFAAAGVADELFVKKTGTLAALGRGASEIFSGIGGIQGEKETFRDVLDGLGLVDETELRQALPGVDDIPIAGGILGGMNLRGSVGLALDIALDPVTWLTGGGSALAKVPRGTKLLRSATPRLTPVLEGATHGLTKKGVRALGAAEDVAMTEIKTAIEAGTRAPGLTDPLWTEAEVLAIEEIKERFAEKLTTQGVKLRAADKFSATAVEKAISPAPEDIFALDELLQGLRPENARKIKAALGLTDANKRADIASTLMKEVHDATDRLVSESLSPESALGALTRDVVRDRAMAAVVEQASHTPGLMREITPLRFMGRSIGPAGKTLTEWVIQSGLSQKTLAAMNKILPTPAITAAMASTAAVKSAYNWFGRNFSSEFSGRNLAGWNMFKNAHIQATGLAVARHHADAAAGEFGQWYSRVLRATKGNDEERLRIFRAFARAADEGKPEMVADLGEGALAALGEFNSRMREMAVRDVRKGLLQASNVRTNYFPHFIEASDTVIEMVAAARPGRKWGTQATIGRHAELRGFDSIADLERAAEMVGQDLKILFDPMAALTKRAETSIEGWFWSDFNRSVAQQFGNVKAVLDPNDYYALTRQLTPEGSKAGRVAERLARARKGAKTSTLQKLHDKYGQDAVGDYLRQRMSNIRGAAGITAFLRKYEPFMEALPKLRRPGELAPDGSRYVDLPGTWKELQGYSIPESAANDLREMSEKIVHTRDMSMLLRGYDNVSNRIKLHLTAMFPSFHFRNAYSNVPQAFLDTGLGALNPAVHRRAALIAADLLGEGGTINLKRSEKLAKSLRETRMAVGGGTRTLEELRAEILRNGVARGGKDMFEAVGKAGVETVPVEGMTWARRAWGAWSRAGRSAGGFIENEARITMYLNLRKRGLSELEATQRVNRALFDYDSLTNFERQYMKRAIPFYVWTKKNVALQASALRNNPGRVAAQVKLLNNEDTDVTNVMADWQTEGFRLQLDRDGKHVRMLTGIDLPIASIDRLLPLGQIMRGQYGEAVSAVVSNMTPLLRVPAEMMSGRELFSGRSLDRVRSDSIGFMLDPENPVGKRIPQSLRRWLGWQKTEWRSGRTSYEFDGPKFNLLFRSWIFSRWISTGDRFIRDVSQGIDNKETWATNMGTAMLTLLTSLKDTEVNLTEAEIFKLAERKKKIEDALLRSGQAREFRRIYQSTSDKAKGRRVFRGEPIIKVGTSGQAQGEQ